MSKPKTQRKPTIAKHVSQDQNQELQKTEKQPSWVVRGLLACRNVQIQQQHQQQKEAKPPPEAKEHQHRKKQEQRKLQEERVPEDNSKKCKKMKCSGSLCNNTKITAKPDTSTPDIHKKRLFLNGCNSNDASSRSMKAPLTEHNGTVSASSSSLSASSTSSGAGSFRGMPFRRLSGCYECRMVVDPVLGFTKDPSLRSSICSCPDCGEIMKAESLEHHQAVKHAVSELGPEDTSKNIVEIIFHSSWLKKQSPVCKIDRILKVHNTQKTITRFEEYRDSIKAKATKLPKKHPRCIADGNELLRFHCTSFACSLGLNGSSNLCNSIPQCNVCSIIKHGFKVTGGTGILTTATSGKAHDKACVDEIDCPSDSDLAESLILRGCHPLPRRRCFSQTPQKPISPNSLPQNPFPSSLPDNAVVWDHYTCKSFDCINRQNPNLGFDPSRDISKFNSYKSDLDLPINQLFQIAKAAKSVLRLGLDVGGGTGSFAAVMKLRNVTVVTTTMNVAAPNSEAVALRGLVPLHVPLQQRLPLFDGVVDLVRCGRAVNRWIPMTVLEFLLFDVDRVLRGGGYLWVDHFFSKRVDLEKVYAPLIGKLGYKKVKWAMGNKTDAGGVKNGEVFLTALLQKPVSR